LVVEDDEIFAETMAIHLWREGFEVEVAADTLTALGYMDTRQFDMIVVDVTMPKSKPSGYSFAAMIRYREPATRIIFVSGDPALAEIAARLPATVFEKPVDLDMLVAEIHRQLGS
jgi:DNA-binding response OmpR family regulator